MAKSTDRSLKSCLFYQIFTRSYSQEGTFDKVTRDLERIKALGTDIIHLLPIHPTGEKNRKGSYGSPYAIKDYSAIDPFYGTEEDLSRLLTKAHSLGMKVLMDIVYNHTSPDSALFKLHPEWFFKKDGLPGNKVGDWWDVYDLDFAQDAEGLQEYLIANLVRWALFGFDGFRCDVASLVPVDFWIRARQTVEQARPGTIWLAESVHGEFVRLLRRQGYIAASDAELYEAFDICYEYDVHGRFHDYIYGENNLKPYKQALNTQQYIFPSNAVKLRFIGNHDMDRPAKLIKDKKILEAWTAFTFFNNGATLVYMGDETLTDHRPSLFEREPIDWSKIDNGFVSLIQRLAEIKKSFISSDATYFEVLENDDDAIVAFHEKGRRRVYGVFKFIGGAPAPQTNLPDGEYKAIIGTDVTVDSGRAIMDGNYSIFEITDHNWND